MFHSHAFSQPCNTVEVNIELFVEARAEPRRNPLKERTQALEPDDIDLGVASFCALAD